MQRDLIKNKSELITVKSLEEKLSNPSYPNFKDGKTLKYLHDISWDITLKGSIDKHD